MKKLLSIALLSLLTMNAYSQESIADRETRVMNRIKLATEYYQYNQYGQALKELMNAQDIYNDYAPLHNMLGVINMDLNRGDEAEKSFKKAISLDKNNSDIHNNYGWFLCTSGKYSEGLEWLKKAWNNPMYNTPEKALYNSGRCAKMSNNIVEAEAYFSKGLSISPRSSAIMYELANIRYEQKNYKDVLPIIDKIHALEGMRSQSLWLALKTERMLGNEAEMSSYGSQLVRKFPNSAEATLWLTKTF